MLVRKFVSATEHQKWQLNQKTNKQNKKTATFLSSPWCKCWWACCTSLNEQFLWGSGSCRRSALQGSAPPGRTSAPVRWEKNTHTQIEMHCILFKYHLLPREKEHKLQKRLLQLSDIPAASLTRFSLTMPSLAAKKARTWEMKCFSSGFKRSQCVKSLDRST